MRSASAATRDPIRQSRGPLGQRPRQLVREHPVDLDRHHPARPASSRASVSEPSPGPTSSTTSSGPGAASAAIRRTVPCSITKFWPSRLDGRTPSRSASFLTSAGLSNRTCGSAVTIQSANPRPGRRTDGTSVPS